MLDLFAEYLVAVPLFPEIYQATTAPNHDRFPPRGSGLATVDASIPWYSPLGPVQFQKDMVFGCIANGVGNALEDGRIV